MSLIGHSIGTETGILLAMDNAVADFLHRSTSELIGMSYMDITHPDDRSSNSDRIRLLRVGDDPVQLRKRYVRPNGQSAWATVRVSKLKDDYGNSQLIGTIFRLDFRQPQTAPEGLWQAARQQMKLISQRNELFGRDLFADNAWLVLLSLYIAEAEGRGILYQEEPLLGGISSNSLRQWLRGLRSRGFVEYLDDPISQPQLTQSGLSKIEILLGPMAAFNGDASFSSVDITRI